MIKVYIDNCVYNRPFDDQTDELIFIEARAFYIIIKWIEESKIISINSDALEYEKNLISNPDRQNRIEDYLSLAKEYMKISNIITERAKGLIKLGFKDMDALHIAMAEFGKANYFVTCDDEIVNIGKRNQKEIKVKVCNILEFIEEAIQNVKND